MAQARMLVSFALQHIGSGKDIDDIKDVQKYGHITGLSQRHKWGLDPGVGTPLQICAMHGGVEACEILIEAGADVNFSPLEHGLQGAPPLHLAIKNGSVAMVKTLLERGADRSLKADMGHGQVDAYQCARVCAEQNPSVERNMISQLVDYFNMPFGTVEKNNLTSHTNPISEENPVSFVKNLIGTGRNINDIHGGLKWAQEPDQTPLAAVTSAGDMEAVRLLLAAGANVNKMDSKFGGPLHYAIKQKHEDIVKVLLDAGADKHAKANEPGALSALEYARFRASQDADWNKICMLVDYHTRIWPAPIRPGQ